MPSAIENTLRELENWFREIDGGTERPKLAKLAMLEFCGWLEHRMDEIVRMAASNCGADSDRIEKMINSTHGFKYDEHFRPMMCATIGDGSVSYVEKRLSSNGTDVDHLRSLLGTYWKTRGSLAHTHMGGVQVTLNAPSWCLNQQRVVGKILTKLEMEALAAANKIRLDAS
ncbi:hypothetical protein LMG27198_05340 [Methylocystis echinoides]|uniref:RiboL-PSP-HEPN domain-containing protein n=1 Tax=Methylocystis echinoides TaxID=29468 RepID=A0A9W6GR42_9HYPH|nr:hypothetical protein LMG27198_05340 [Methylocystis echinoides]